MRLCERFVGSYPDLGATLVERIDVTDARTCLQAAFSLGEWRDSQAGRALTALALKAPDDDVLAAAVVSSARGSNLLQLLTGLTENPNRMPPMNLVRQLFATAAALPEHQFQDVVIPLLLRPQAPPRYATWQLAGMATLLDAVDQRGSANADGVIRLSRGMIHEAAQLAADSGAADSDRVVAVELLGRDPNRNDAYRALLARFLTPRHSATLQTSAATALARIPGTETATALLAGWPGYSPSLQSRVLDLLLSRNDGSRLLVEAIERQDVPARQVDSAHRQRLTGTKDAAVRERAAKLFAGDANPDRQRVLDAYQDSLKLSGDVTRGKASFIQRCAACHRLNDVGHAVGPDLASVATKTPQYLLQEILDPNRNVDSRYVEYTAATKNGRVFTGLLAGETASSITLRGQDGREEVLPRADLETLQSSGRSLMPERLEQFLSKQDLADLIAYLTTSAGR
jgi:putative heme-binding domain-containing protein